MRHLLFLVLILGLNRSAEAHWEWAKNAVKFCLMEVGLMSRGIEYNHEALQQYFTKMTHEANITRLKNYPVGKKGIELIEEMENLKLIGKYRPFVDRSELSGFRSEEFTHPQLVGILSRGVKDLKITLSESEDRVKIEITFVDGKKAYVFAGKQECEGCTENFNLTGIDTRPTYHHFFIQNETGSGYYVASQRYDQNSKDTSKALRRKLENQPDDSFLRRFEENWEKSEPLPDPFAPPPVEKPKEEKPK